MKIIIFLAVLGIIIRVAYTVVKRIVEFNKNVNEYSESDWTGDFPETIDLYSKYPHHNPSEAHLYE